jgi:hypothetical protein
VDWATEFGVPGNIENGEDRSEGGVALIRPLDAAGVVVISLVWS